MPLFDIFQKTQDEEETEEKPKLRIIADHREKNSMVISELMNNNIIVDMKNLPVADFLIGEIAIERKTTSDFLNSMINKRLARQLEEMKQFPKQLLIIEGLEEQSLYEDKKEGINSNAIRGFLLSILLKYNVPIIYTKNYEDTAKFLIVLLKRMEKTDVEFGLRAKKKALSTKEQKQFILEGFPNIGPSTAKKLLKKFGNIKNIINASEEELKKEIGKKSESFFKLLE